MIDCRQTHGLVARIVDDRVTDADRVHAAGCPSCGPVLARAARFDDELGRAARTLVAEELPRGILDQPVGGGVGEGVVSRRGAPGLTAILAAVTILLIGTVIALGPGTGPRASPSPGAPSSLAPSPEPTRTKPPFVERFTTTAAIVGQLSKVGYSCNDGAPLASVGTEPDVLTKEAAACTAPDSIGPFILAVIVGEAANGKVIELHVKADIVGPDVVDSRVAVAAEIARVFELALVDEGAGQSGGSWAEIQLIELEPGTGAEVVLRQVDFRAERLPNASYFVVVRGVDAS
jgi:hypothetical protein